MGSAVGGAVALQAQSALPGAVVEDDLVVAASAALAGRQGLGLDAGQDGVVRVAGELDWLALFRCFCGCIARKPHGGVAGCVGCALGYLVGLLVALPAPVVQTAYDDGAVYVATQETDEDFLAMPRGRAASRLTWAWCSRCSAQPLTKHFCVAN